MFRLSILVLGFASCIVLTASDTETNLTQEGQQQIFFCGWDLIPRRPSLDLYKCHPASGETHSIWRSGNYIFNVINNKSIDLVAFLEIETEERTGMVQFSTLRIIKQDGTLVSTIRKEHAVQEFSWSPTGQEVAFILGDYVEEGSFYDPKGVYVYDIETEKIEQISEYGRGLHWSRFDGRLYYLRMDKNYKREVFAYDFQEKSEKKTNYRSTDFSRNETYYYFFSGDPTLPSELYERATNTSVTDRSESPVSHLALIRLIPIKWLDDHHLFAYHHRFHDNKVYFILDVSTGRIRKTDNFILQEYSPGVVAVQKPDGSFGLEEVDSMTEVQPEDLPKTLDEVRAEQKAEKKNPTPK